MSAREENQIQTMEQMNSKRGPSVSAALSDVNRLANNACWSGNSYSYTWCLAPESD